MQNKTEHYRLRKLIDKKAWEIFAENKCFLAGGSLIDLYNNNKEINDFDIYVKDAKTAYKTIYQLYNKKYSCVSKTKKSFLFSKTGKVNINIVVFDFFENLEQVFNSFDFTCCMGGFDFGKNEFSFHPDFYRDNLLKRLYYSQKSNFPIGALLRVEKYKQKGFSISKNELVKIALHCNKLKIETLKDLEDQISGMYGVDLNEMYKDNPESFSINDFLDKIENLKVDLNKKETKYYDIDEITSNEIWDEIFEYKEIKGNIYKMLDDLILSKIERKDIPKSIKIEQLEKVFLYKWVRVNEETNELESCFDPTFKYKVNEYVEEKTSPYIYVCGKQDVNRVVYNHKKNNCLIEILVNAEDILNNNLANSINLQIKKGLVTRIVKKSNR